MPDKRYTIPVEVLSRSPGPQRMVLVPSTGGQTCCLIPADQLLPGGRIEVVPLREKGPTVQVSLPTADPECPGRPLTRWIFATLLREERRPGGMAAAPEGTPLAPEPEAARPERQAPRVVVPSLVVQ